MHTSTAKTRMQYFSSQVAINYYIAMLITQKKQVCNFDLNKCAKTAQSVLIFTFSTVCVLHCTTSHVITLLCTSMCQK